MWTRIARRPSSASFRAARARRGWAAYCGRDGPRTPCEVSVQPRQGDRPNIDRADASELLSGPRPSVARRLSLTCCPFGQLVNMPVRHLDVIGLARNTQPEVVVLQAPGSLHPIIAPNQYHRLAPHRLNRFINKRVKDADESKVAMRVKRASLGCGLLKLTINARLDFVEAARP
jgi:hypothetical protein